MAVVHYAGNRITGLTADTKPTNVREGALFFELDGDKRVFEYLNGAWEILIGADVSINLSYFEITGGTLTLSAAFIAAVDVNTGHRGQTNNPHSVTKSQVGLGNVSNDLQVKNADKASQADAEAGTNDTKWMTPLKTKQAVDQFGGGGGGITLHAEITSATTLTASHSNKYIPVNSASPINITIDGSVHSETDQIVLEQTGNGVITVVAGTGMTLNGGLNSMDQYKVLTIFFKSATVATVIGGE